jgi:VWFA-related protein
MRVNSQSGRALLALAASVLAFGPLAVSAPAATGAVTMTVTAVGRKDAAPPPIKKEDVELYQGKERVQVVDWKHADTLALAILISDSLDPEAASQWNELKAFIEAQPPSTYIALGYGRNGAVQVAQDFTTDHALVTKALRIPLGSGGAFTSPYLSVQDWIKRWPDNGSQRRSIIMISSGVDYFRGSFDPIDPDMQTTQEMAQKANINIWTVYYPDAGHLGRRTFRIFDAQSNLSRLSEATGAESYYLGFNEPVTLKPYLDEIQQHLDNQYLLTFAPTGVGKKGKFDRVRVSTEVPQVQFMTFPQIFVPPSQ